MGLGAGQKFGFCYRRLRPTAAPGEAAIWPNQPNSTAFPGQQLFGFCAVAVGPGRPEAAGYDGKTHLFGKRQAHLKCCRCIFDGANREIAVEAA